MFEWKKNGDMQKSLEELTNKVAHLECRYSSLVPTRQIVFISCNVNKYGADNVVFLFSGEGGTYTRVPPHSLSSITFFDSLVAEGLVLVDQLQNLCCFVKKSAVDLIEKGRVYE